MTYQRGVAKKSLNNKQENVAPLPPPFKENLINFYLYNLKENRMGELYDDVVVRDQH